MGAHALALPSLLAHSLACRCRDRAHSIHLAGRNGRVPSLAVPEGDVDQADHWAGRLVDRQVGAAWIGFRPAVGYVVIAVGFVVFATNRRHECSTVDCRFGCLGFP